MIPTLKHILLLIAVFTFSIQGASEAPYSPEVGDIYFQSLGKSPLVEAIEGVSNSPYSHCGILDKIRGKWVIHEAIGPVKTTLLEDWIQQGEESQYDVYRLIEEYRPKIQEFLMAIDTYMGKPYDIHYDFDDEKIYCSELLFKAFKSVYDEELGEIVTLGSLNWKPHEDFIRSIDPSLPLERLMITPKHLSQATQLESIYKSIEQSK